MTLHHINPTQSYLLAVSGGVDSMVLATLFLQMKLKFSIAHCNFGLRGQESDDDESFIKQWCQEHTITLFSKKFDTKAFANEKSISIQEAARTLRYEFFNLLKKEHQFDWIVTAHHEDDNIETLLFHFFRGTGLQGLSGIPEAEHGILRPLLTTSRTEIEAFAKKNQIQFRTDSSNASEKYTRNKLRHSVIPMLEDMFPSFKQNISSSILRFKEINALYQAHVQKLRSTYLEQRGQDYYIPIRKLSKAKPLKTILFELVKPFGFSNAQLDEIIKLMTSNSGASLSGSEYRIIKHNHFLIITSLKIADSDFMLLQSNTTELNVGHWQMKVKHLAKVPKEFPKAKDEMYCNATLLEWPLMLRKWKAGDYMYPLGMQKKKKIARILIDAKIPLHEKENIWVLESNKKIVWLIGMALDDRFKLKETAQESFHIKLVKQKL